MSDFEDGQARAEATALAEWLNSFLPSGGCASSAVWIAQVLGHLCTTRTAKVPRLSSSGEESCGLVGILNGALGWGRWRLAATLEDDGTVSRFDCVEWKE